MIEAVREDREQRQAEWVRSGRSLSGVDSFDDHQGVVALHQITPGYSQAIRVEYARFLACAHSTTEPLVVAGPWIDATGPAASHWSTRLRKLLRSLVAAIRPDCMRYFLDGLHVAFMYQDNVELVLDELRAASKTLEAIDFQSTAGRRRATAGRRRRADANRDDRDGAGRSQRQRGVGNQPSAVSSAVAVADHIRSKRRKPKAPKAFIPRAFQLLILEKLKGRALRTDALGNEVKGRRRLFKKNGLRELMRHGFVQNHASLGYFRPDAPPPEHAAFLGQWAPKGHQKGTK
jgi:hypothetical protein